MQESFNFQRCSPLLYTPCRLNSISDLGLQKSTLHLEVVPSTLYSTSRTAPFRSSLPKPAATQPTLSIPVLFSPVFLFVFQTSWLFRAKSVSHLGKNSLFPCCSALSQQPSPPHTRTACGRGATFNQKASTSFILSPMHISRSPCVCVFRPLM